MATASTPLPPATSPSVFPLGPAWILDGGLATELIRTHGLKLDGDPLWSARAVLDFPDALRVLKTYAYFFEAGADVGTTASYQARTRTS